MLSNELAVPFAAVLYDSGLGRVVDVDEPEALAESVAPFKVVEKRPHEIAFQPDPLRDRSTR